MILILLFYARITAILSKLLNESFYVRVMATAYTYLYVLTCIYPIKIYLYECVYSLNILKNYICILIIFYLFLLKVLLSFDTDHE